MDKYKYHQSVQKSATLNRKYVSRPTIHIEIDKVEEVAEVAAPAPAVLAEEPIPVEVDEPLVPEEPLRSILLQAPDAGIINRTKKIEISDGSEAVIINQIEGEATPPPTPRELKNEAVKKALHRLDEQKEAKAVSAVVADEKKTEKQLKKADKAKKQSKRTLSDSFKKEKRHSSFGKFVLAFATSAACIGVLGYFVSLNMPSISVRVAAMQTGIEASYPTYVPRDYQLSGVSTGDNNTVTITFTGKDSDSFYITEERSSWDSNALLNNYVKTEWGDDYDTLREQGITLYVHNSNAVWVNGGILYKLNTAHGSLSKKIIKNIALSL